MKVTNLASGSKGNCSLIETNNILALVDIGLNAKKLKDALSVVGKSVGAINALLITHEHVDHVGGLDGLIKNCPNIDIYVHPLVWGQIIKKNPKMADFQRIHYFEFDVPFRAADLTIMPLENMHDSITCASFIISSGGGKVGFATDLGIITDYQIGMLSDCKVVYLEANHDRQMLYGCAYPKIVKDRIASANGHLSNEQCAEAASKLILGQTKVIVLSHISQNSNREELAYSVVAAGIPSLRGDIRLLISYQDKVGKTITIT